jgi:hypothetical protein
MVFGIGDACAACFAYIMAQRVPRKPTGRLKPRPRAADAAASPCRGFSGEASG